MRYSRKISSHGFNNQLLTILVSGDPVTGSSRDSLEHHSFLESRWYHLQGHGLLQNHWLLPLWLHHDGHLPWPPVCHHGPLVPHLQHQAHQEDAGHCLAGCPALCSTTELCIPAKDSPTEAWLFAVHHYWIFWIICQGQNFCLLWNFSIFVSHDIL